MSIETTAPEATTVATTPISAGLPTFWALLARDLRVLRREGLMFFVRSVMQPLLFVFVFSYVLPKIGPGGGSPFASAAPAGISFSTVLVPGLVAMSMNFQGIQAVALPLVTELSFTNEIEDRVLAPIPVWSIALEKIVAGAIQAILAAIVVFPIVLLVHASGQAPNVHVSNWPLFLFVLVLAALLASASGLFLGTVINPRKISVLFAVVVLPITFLGCVYYPWAALHSIRWLQVIVLLNPLVYMSEGLRASLTPALPHMAWWAYSLALVGGVAAIGALALRTFTRRIVT
jgi:ABC-2 type transport system permease protein